MVFVFSWHLISILSVLRVTWSLRLEHLLVSPSMLPSSIYVHIIILLLYFRTNLLYILGILVALKYLLPVLHFTMDMYRYYLSLSGTISSKDTPFAELSI